MITIKTEYTAYYYNQDGEEIEYGDYSQNEPISSIVDYLMDSACEEWGITKVSVEKSEIRVIFGEDGIIFFAKFNGQRIAKVVQESTFNYKGISMTRDDLTFGGIDGSKLTINEMKEIVTKTWEFMQTNFVDSRYKARNLVINKRLPLLEHPSMDSIEIQD